MYRVTAVRALLVAVVLAAGVLLACTTVAFDAVLISGLLAASGLLLLGWRHTFWRRFSLAVIVVLGLLAIPRAARDVPGIITASDFAVIELYTELATRGQLLVGAYSRFGWHHPGPIYFYLVAPFYAASGHQAAVLYSAAVAINLAAILTLGWVAARLDRGALLIWVMGACLLFAWRVPRLLASPWTAHVPVLASLTFVALCGAVVAGRPRLLPLAVLFGSFITQTHLAFGPMTMVLLVVAAAAAAARTRREPRRLAAVLLVSAAVGIGLWSLPLIEAASRGGGNVAELWRFFVSGDGASHSMSHALRNWSHGLVGILRSDLALPWGGHFSTDTSHWTMPVAVAQLIALPMISWWSFRQGRQTEGGVAGCAFLASALGLWAMTRIRGDIVDHEIFWLSALGALNLALIGSALLGVLTRRMRIDLGSWTHGAVLGTGAVLYLACVQIGVHHLRDSTAFELRRTDRPRIPATYAIIRDFISAQGIRKPVIQIHDDTWGDAAGIMLRLLQDNTPFSVDDAAVPMFTDALRQSGDEDAAISLSAREGIHQQIAARSGNVVLRDRAPLFVDVVRLDRNRPRDIR